MAIEIVIPRLGWNMDEGVFSGWLKQDGDTVRAGDPLFSLEGEKATQDIEAIDQGILRIPPDAPGVGDRIPVGAVIGYLLQAGESVPVAAAAPQARVVEAPAVHASAATVGPDNDRSRNGPRISPLARRIARELGVDWSGLQGSGSTGRIRKVDVLAAARSRGEPRDIRVAPAAAIRSVPVTSIRRTIAARMVESLRTTAPVTLTTTVDATNLVNLRDQFKSAAVPGRVVPGYTDFVVKLTALALGDHPLLNARWTDDGIVIAEEVHVGIAVDTDAGLLVPVIRDAANLGLGLIAARARDLVERARAGRLQAGEMQGSTFTITNLGSFGIEAFTPIINNPECAILGMGRIQRQPVMSGDRVVGRERLSLSLTFDHRIVDGAPAARFLQSLGRLIENPGPWLIA